MGFDQLFEQSARPNGSRRSSIESSNDFDSRDSLKEFDQLFEQSARPNGSPRSSDRDSDTTQRSKASSSGNLDDADDFSEFLPCDQNDLYPQNTEVEVFGLSADDDLNGSLGKVLGKDPNEPARYQVEIIRWGQAGANQYDSDELVSMKLENLRRISSGSKVSSEQSDSARSNGSRRSSMETSQDLDSRDSL